MLVCMLGVSFAIGGLYAPGGKTVELGVGIISFGTALLFLASLHTQKQQLAEQREELELQRKELAHQSTEFARQNQLAVWQTMVEYFVVLLSTNNSHYDRDPNGIRGSEGLLSAMFPMNEQFATRSELHTRPELWRKFKYYCNCSIIADSGKKTTLSDELEYMLEPYVSRPFPIYAIGHEHLLELNTKTLPKIYNILNNRNIDLFISSIVLINHLKNMQEFHEKELGPESKLWDSLGIRYLFSTEWMVLNLYHLLFFRGEVQLAQFMAQHIITDRPLRIWALQQASDLLKLGRTDLFENL